MSFDLDTSNPVSDADAGLHADLVAFDAAVKTFATSQNTLIDKFSLRHVLFASTTAVDGTFVSSFDNPPLTSTNSKVDWATVYNRVITDGFVVDPKAIIDSIIRLVFLVCKQYAIHHAATRVGTCTGTTCTNSTVKSFDNATRAACNAHITNMVQIIINKDNVTNTITNLNGFLTLCRAEITKYRTKTSELAKKEGATDHIGMSLVSSVMTTNTLFNKTTSIPDIEDIIYYCMLPFFKVLYISTLEENFVDIWKAQCVVYLFGVGLIDTLIGLTPQPAFGTAFLRDFKATIAKTFNATATADDELNDMHRETLTAMHNNAKLSDSMTVQGNDLYLRRKNMEIIGTHYVNSKAEAKKARITFYIAVSVYSVLTALVAGLVVIPELSEYSILASGGIMVAIIIYALVMQLKTI